MATEIERKFLVTGDGWRENARKMARLRQGYLSAVEPSVRVRLTDQGTATLAVKLGAGMVREEFEYAVPANDARVLLDACGARVIDKTRYRSDAGGGAVWDIDVYHGRLDGLVIAELELPDRAHPVPACAWLGVELTGATHWSNLHLAIHGLPDDAPANLRGRR